MSSTVLLHWYRAGDGAAPAFWIGPVPSELAAAHSGYVRAALATVRGGQSSALRLTLPAHRTPSDSAWRRDDFAVLAAVLAQPAPLSASALAAAWFQRMPFATQADADAVAVAHFLRLHRLGRFLGIEAVVAACEEVLGVRWPNVLVLQTQSDATDRFLHQVLGACAAEPDERSDLFMRLVAWADTAYISMRAAAAAADDGGAQARRLRAQWRAYLVNELHVDVARLAFLDETQMQPSAVCAHCLVHGHPSRRRHAASEGAPSDHGDVDEALQVRAAARDPRARASRRSWPLGPEHGEWRFYRSTTHDHDDDETAGHGPMDVEVTTLRGDAQRGFGLYALNTDADGASVSPPASLASDASLYTGICTSCRLIQPLHIHWIRPRTLTAVA